MKSPHLLKLGNVRKVKNNLSSILSSRALTAIEKEIERNARELYSLARRHYQFAEKLSAPHWRQKVSRSYYAAYNAARAVRLYVEGDYSTDIKDHQKFDKLPDDFPRKDRYVNQLGVLRADRNTCDYDHVSVAADLVLGTRQSLELVSSFLEEVKSYLQLKGLEL